MEDSTTELGFKACDHIFIIKLTLYTVSLQNNKIPTINLINIKTLMTTYQTYLPQQSYIFFNLDLQAGYHSISYVAENTPKLYPSLPDDSLTSEDEPVPDHLKTTIEEKTFRTIPGSAIATAVALSHSKPQANPVVPRYKRRKSKSSKKTTMALVPKTAPIQAVQLSVCSIL